MVRGDNGDLRLMTENPEVLEALEVAEKVMDENRDALQALA